MTSIGDYAFENCSLLASVEIPNSVTSIGDYAFENCSLLTSVEIPNSVTSIGYSAFRGCSSLESITLPFVGANKNASGNTDFGYMFGKKSSGYYDIPSSLKHVVITDGSVIASCAFADCKEIETIIIKEGVSTIESYAFAQCTSLKEIEIPNSVISIGQDALVGCKALIKIKLPFVGCGESAYGHHLKVFGAIFGFTSSTDHPYTEYDFIWQYKEEGAYPKYYSYPIPKTLRVVEITRDDIPARAFYNCRFLTEISFVGNSVGKDAFYNCSSLEVVNYQGTLDSWALNGLGREFKTPYDLCINNSKVRYANIENITKISEYAFQNCISLLEVKIGGCVKDIGAFAFNGCDSLQKMTLPFLGASVMTNNGYDQVFGFIFGYFTTTDADVAMHYNGVYRKSSIFTGDIYYCYYIPKTLRFVTIIGNKIPDYAFYSCDSLEIIILEESVTRIGIHAFTNCSSITNITFNDTSNWYRTTDGQGINTIVTNPTANADYFKYTYNYYYWYKI